MGLFSKKEKVAAVAEGTVVSPVNGKVAELKVLKDGVFSEAMLGQGSVVVLPKDAKTTTFYAPMTGELVAAMASGHAYGIKNKAGVELLLHIGIDTVNLNGKGFKMLVKQGQKVTAGQALVEVDVELVRKNAPSSDAIVIITSGQTPKNKAAAGAIEAKAKLYEVA